MSSAPASKDGLLPTAAAVLALCLLGAAALYHGTLGLRVVSTESARRLQVAESPRPVPDVGVRLPEPARLAQSLRGDGRVAIATFIYTRCLAVCSALGSEMQQMQALLRERGLEDRVRLLSISFDPRDTPDDLRAYAAKLGADPAVWQFAGVADDAERAALLEQFGVVVLPAPLGEYQHNAAFHLIDGSARFARIVDYDRPVPAIEAAVRLARGRP